MDRQYGFRRLRKEINTEGTERSTEDTEKKNSQHWVVRPTLENQGWGTLKNPRVRAQQGEFEAEGLVPKGFAGFEGVGDAGLGEFFAAEPDEGFAFEVENVLFADGLRSGERAAGEDIG